MDISNLKTVAYNFAEELQKGSNGQESSLMFIKHMLSSEPFVKENEVFQVLVVGGSIYQKAIMRKKDDNFHLINQEQGQQPPFKSKQAILEFIASHLDPDVSVLAMNFAYPLEPVFRDNRLDGKLQAGSKENTFEGMIGETVGQEVEKYIKETLNRDIKVSIANDTICLLLSGLTQYEGEELAAGIVGTGLNFAIFLDPKTCVNLESAYFDKFPTTAVGEEIDKESSEPGKALCEKYVSGAYLYKHFNILAKERGMNIMINSTQELDELGQDSRTEEGKIARQVLKQSYSLTATQIAGILQYQKRDIVFIMQGSLFWRGYMYKENVEKIVDKICPDYKATYVNVFHSDLYGAAKLVA